MTFEESYKQRIQEYLTEITECKIVVTWLSDISERIDKNTIRIILNKLPSVLYKTSTIYSIQLTAICDKSIQDECYRILELYQADNFNKKFYLDNRLCFESYYSPSADNQFVELGTNTGIQISMQGSVVVADEYCELEKIEINGEEVNTISVKEISSASMVAQPTFEDEETRVINDSRTYELILTLPFTNSNFSLKCRGYMYGLIESNTIFKVKITYTDGFEVELDMIIIGIEKDANNNQISGLVVVMRRA